jgi:hypothetical protein
LAVAGLIVATVLVLGACSGGAGRADSHAPSVDVSGGAGRPAAGRSAGAGSSRGSGRSEAAGAVAAPGTCPGVTQPPGAPYALTVRGRITGTLTVAHDDNHSRYPAVIPKISARFCGTLDVAGETGTVAASNISFAPTVIDLAYHLDKHGRPTELTKDPVEFVPVGAAVATIVRTGAANGAARDGGLELSLVSHVDTIVFPAPPSHQIRCVDGPVTLDLSTEVTGGSPLVGPLQHARTTVTETGFTIPAVAGGQKACYDGPNFPFAPILNQLLYLPARDTATTETLVVGVAG